LAAYQRVAAVEFRETLPRNQLGKLLKRALREAYWNGGQEIEIAKATTNW
jgi:long-chain acyl-CoA synthetase